MTPKLPSTALIFSFFVPGGGHLYVGRIRRFVIALLLLSPVIAILAHTDLLATFAGFAIGGLSVVSFSMFALIDPYLLARRTPFPIKRWYMTPSVYVLYALGMAILLLIVNRPSVSTTFRSEVLGYDLYSIGSSSMSPTLMPTDRLLIDTRYYQNHAPMVGELVLARSPDNSTTFVRRIRVVTDSDVWVAPDHLRRTQLEPPDLLLTTQIPISNIRGRATYILFSRDLKRIGTSLMDSEQANEVLSSHRHEPQITPEQ